MSDRIAEIVVLAEDLPSATLLRRYLLRLRVSPRAIRLERAPPGQQSAYDWVTSRYPKEVDHQRRRVRAGGANLAALVVHVDADELTVAERTRRLAGALRGAGQPARAPAERIVLVIPRRNAETWIHGLCGARVDELYDCKRDPEGRIASNSGQRDRLRQERLKPAAEELYRLTRAGAPEPPASLPALGPAVTELRRLEG